RETRFFAEFAEHLEVVGNDLEQHLGGDILHIFRADPCTSQVRGVADGVVDQAEEAVHEVVPRPGFAVEAPPKQVAVHRGKRRVVHVREPLDKSNERGLLSAWARSVLQPSVSGRIPQPPDAASTGTPFYPLPVRPSQPDATRPSFVLPTLTNYEPAYMISVPA